LPMKKLGFLGKLIKVYNVNGMDLVIHPGASVIIPILPDNKVVLVRQYRFPIKQYTWEVPAGTLKKGEPPLVCAKRELEEETGFKAGKIRKLLHFYSSPGFLVEKMHIYLATNLKKGKQNFDEDEDIDVGIFTIAETKRLIKTNKLTDSKTLIALLYLLDFLNK
jgi:ADP-ribose pyrophosphatase